MLSSNHVEDIFLDFYHEVAYGKIPAQSQDQIPIHNFAEKIKNGESLTHSQGNFVLKLLEKYKNLSAMAGLDYRNVLSSLTWKKNFRVLDLTKKIYVEKSDNGKLEICVKFPYHLKKEFEEEILSSKLVDHKTNYWDNNEKVRKLDFYEYNVISLFEFSKKHQFEIDDSFITALAEVEEIWQNIDNLSQRSSIVNNKVVLINASEDVGLYFKKHSLDNNIVDAFTAKCMGYPLDQKGEAVLSKIASSADNAFWIKDLDLFFEIFKSIKGKICIVLDRSGNTLPWLQKFVSYADKNQISRDEIKVCFRESKESTTGLNAWIKSAGVGGKIEGGNILIFESKPAKWLFKDDQDVKILATNSAYPPANQMTKDWFFSHPCVLYIGDIKPSGYKDQKIVEL